MSAEKIEGPRRWQLKTRKEIVEFFEYMGCSEKTNDDTSTFKVLAKAELASSQLMDVAKAMGAKPNGKGVVKEMSADMHNIHVRWRKT